MTPNWPQDKSCPCLVDLFVLPLICRERCLSGAIALVINLFLKNEKILEFPAWCHRPRSHSAFARELLTVFLSSPSISDYRPESTSFCFLSSYEFPSNTSKRKVNINTFYLRHTEGLCNLVLFAW